MGRVRVIAGSAGGLFLKTPKRHHLRPTQDRIRQVIFSSLGDAVIDARVADLYAGSGAIGIEALSRGCTSAVFVEQDKEAYDCIRDNLTHCRLKADVKRQSVEEYLRFVPSEPTLDLVFTDPPYEKTYEPLNGGWLESVFPHVVSNGQVIWEHFAGQKPPIVNGWQIVRHRTYGETGLTFYAKL